MSSSKQYRVRYELSVNPNMWHTVVPDHVIVEIICSDKDDAEEVYKSRSLSSMCHKVQLISPNGSKDLTN